MPMSAVGLEGIDHTVQITHEWINELNEALQWGNKGRSYHLLRSVLHALRDWLQVNEAADLAAQLPTLLRGVYYDQWRPAATPIKPRDAVEFLNHIDAAFLKDPLEDTEGAVGEVLALLERRISAGEIKDVKQALPAAVRALWPL
jgi:uncharacterized protein (DUF2267 family)